MRQSESRRPPPTLPLAPKTQGADTASGVDNMSIEILSGPPSGSVATLPAVRGNGWARAARHVVFVRCRFEPFVADILNDFAVLTLCALRSFLIFVVFHCTLPSSIPVLYSPRSPFPVLVVNASFGTPPLSSSFVSASHICTTKAEGAASLLEQARAYAFRNSRASPLAWSRYLRDAKAGTIALATRAGHPSDVKRGGTLTAKTVAAAAAAVMRVEQASSPVASPRPSLDEGQSPSTIHEQAGVEMSGRQVESPLPTPATNQPFPVNPLQAHALHANALAARIEEDETARAQLWEKARKWTFGYELESRWKCTSDLVGDITTPVTTTAPSGAEEKADGGSGRGSVSPRASLPMPTAWEISSFSFGAGGVGDSGNKFHGHPVCNRQPRAEGSTMGPSGRLARGGRGSGGGSGASSGSGIVARTNRLLESPNSGDVSTATTQSVSAEDSQLLSALITSAAAKARGSISDRRKASVRSNVHDRSNSAPEDIALDGRLFEPFAVRAVRGLSMAEKRHLPPSEGGVSAELPLSAEDLLSHTNANGAGSALRSPCAKTPPAGTMETSAVGAKRERHDVPPDSDHGDMDIFRALERLPKRVHHTAMYPLIVPVASPPLKAISTRGSRRDEDYAEGATGTGVGGFTHGSPKEGLFSGPWGGDYTEEEGRWGSGRWETRDPTWDALGPFPRRKFGSGGMESISEVDALGRPRAWTSSSGSSLAVTHESGSVNLSAGGRGGGGSGVRSITPDHGSHYGLGVAGDGLWALRDKGHPTQISEPFDDTELSRSRSAVDSRDSVENSFDDETALVGGGGGEGGGGSRARSCGAGGESGEAGWVGDYAGGSADLRQVRSMSVLGLRGGRGRELFSAETASTAAGGCGSGGFISRPRRKTSAVDELAKETAATHGSASVAQTAAGEQGSHSGLFSSIVETDAEQGEKRVLTIARRFVDAYSAYLVDSLGFRLLRGVGEGATEGNDEFGKARAVPSQAAGNGVGKTQSSPCDGGEYSTSHFDGRRSADGLHGVGSGGGGGDRRGSSNSATSDESGCGGPILARSILRVAMPWTNSVALVEVRVGGDWAKSGASASAMARTTPQAQEPSEGGVDGASRGGGVYLRYVEQQHQPCLTEIVVATIMMWTVDIEPPVGVPSYSNSSVAGRGGKGGGLWSITSTLPTLRSFRWTTLSGSESCGNELPRELSRVLTGLRFRQSVNDFIVAQVWIIFAILVPRTWFACSRDFFLKCSLCAWCLFQNWLSVHSHRAPLRSLCQLRTQLYDKASSCCLCHPLLSQGYFVILPPPRRI